MTHTYAGTTARLLGAGLRALLVLTLVCGVLYPPAVTGAAQALFPGRADGSEVTADGRTVGSELIGQRSDLPAPQGGEAPAPDLRWFQPRPSAGLATNSVNTRYDLLVSGASNLSGDNEELIGRVKAAKAAVVADNSVPGHRVRSQDVPPDAVTSSGSASTRTSPRPTPSSRSAGSPPATTWTPTGWRSWSRTTPRDGPWASSESPG